MKKVKVYFMSLLAVASISMTAVSASAQEDNSLGITVGVDYMSNYLWRGSYWFQNDGAFFPSASFDVMGSGLSLTVSGEFSEDYLFDGVNVGDSVKDLQATDFGADYSYTFADAVTLGASVWYYMLWDNDLSFATGTISLTFDTLPLSPTVVYNHDYYTGDLGEGVDKGKDFYIQAGGSHSFELVKDVASLDLGVMAGYYDSASCNTSGISDINFSADFAVTSGIITYSAGFHYVVVPSKDYYYDLNDKKDINRFYATFGVSCSI